MPLALVIEDDLGLRMLFGKALERADFKVLLASNCKDALTLLAERYGNLGLAEEGLDALKEASELGSSTANRGFRTIVQSDA